MKLAGKAVGLLAVPVLAFGGGFLLAGKIHDWIGGEPTRVVHADPATIEKSRVDPTPGLLERAQLGRVKPTEVRIGTAPSAAGAKRVAAYCEPVAVGQLVQAQTSAQPPAGHIPVVIPQQVGPRVLPDFNGRVSGRKVFLSSTLNDGTPWDALYKVRGRWTFASDGDSVVVRSERFWSRFGRGVLRCGAIAGVGASIGLLANSGREREGAIRGAAIGGGTCAVLEVAF